MEVRALIANTNIVNQPQKEFNFTQFANESLNQSLKTKDLFNIQVDSSTPSHLLNNNSKIYESLEQQSTQQLEFLNQSQQQPLVQGNQSLFDKSFKQPLMNSIPDALAQNKSRSISTGSYTKSNQAKRMNQYFRQRQLYATKAESINITQQDINPDQGLTAFSRNLNNLRKVSNQYSFNYAEYYNEQERNNNTIDLSNLQSSIIISKIVQQDLSQNRSPSKSPQRIKLGQNSDLNDINKKLESSKGKVQNNETIIEEITLSKRTEKLIELNLSDIAMINQEQRESINSITNRIASELQTPHSGHENNNYLLRPKGLVLIQDSSLKSNNNISGLTNKSLPYGKHNLHSQSKLTKGKSNSDLTDIIPNLNLSKLNIDQLQSATDIQYNKTMYLEYHQLGLQPVGAVTLRMSNHNQSITHNHYQNQVLSQQKQRVKSQSSISDLSNILDVKQLSTDHNATSKVQNRLNKTVIVHQKTIKKEQNNNQQKSDVNTIQPTTQGIDQEGSEGQENPEILQIRVEQKAVTKKQSQNDLIQESSDQFNPQQQAADLRQIQQELRTDPSNEMTSSLNFTELQPISDKIQVHKLPNHQLQASIAHTPPDWDSVYQHNHSSMDFHREQQPKVFIVNSQRSDNSNNVKKAFKSHQKKVSNKSNLIKGMNQGAFIGKQNINALDNIEVKTLGINPKQSQMSQQMYHLSSSKTFENGNESQYSDQKQLYNMEQQQHLEQKIIGEKRELIFSVQKSQRQDELATLRDVRNTCVGTDELENLMIEDQNNDQLTSQISSRVNVQFSKTIQNNNQIMIEKGSVNLLDNKPYVNVTGQYPPNQSLPFSYTHQNFTNGLKLAENQDRLQSSGTKNSNQMNTFRNQSNNSRVIVKNVMGKNKVLYVQNNGKSVDSDYVKEIKCEQLKISGDQIMPINSGSLNSSFYMQFQQANQRDPNIYRPVQYTIYQAQDQTQNLVPISNDLANQIFQNFNDNQLGTTQQNSQMGMESAANQTMKTQMGDFSFKNQLSTKRNNNNHNHSTTHEELPVDASDPQTTRKHQRYETSDEKILKQHINSSFNDISRVNQPKHQSNFSSHNTRNLVPTVLITSSNFKHTSQLVDNSQIVQNDQMYQNPYNQQLRTAPTVASRGKLPAFRNQNPNNAINRNKKQEDQIDKHNIRGHSTDIRESNQFDKTLMRNQNNLHKINHNSRTFDGGLTDSQQNSQSTQKGLFYKISQQFTKAVNKTKDQVNNDESQGTGLKLGQGGTPLLENDLNLGELIVPQKTRVINEQQAQNLYGEQQNYSRTFQHNSFYNSVTYNNQGSITPPKAVYKHYDVELMGQYKKQQSAIEKKIFRKERILNNADKCLNETQGYPFFIPSKESFQPLKTSGGESGVNIGLEVYADQNDYSYTKTRLASNEKPLFISLNLLTNLSKYKRFLLFKKQAKTFILSKETINLIIWLIIKDKKIAHYASDCQEVTKKFNHCYQQSQQWNHIDLTLCYKLFKSNIFNFINHSSFISVTNLIV